MLLPEDDGVSEIIGEMRNKFTLMTSGVAELRGDLRITRDELRRLSPSGISHLSNRDFNSFQIAFVS